MEWITAQVEVVQSYGLGDWYRAIMMLMGHVLTAMTVYRMVRRRAVSESSLLVRLKATFSRNESCGDLITVAAGDQITSVTRSFNPTKRDGFEYRIVLSHPRRLSRLWLFRKTELSSVQFLRPGTPDPVVTNLVEGKEYHASERKAIIEVAQAAIALCAKRNEAERKEKERLDDLERQKIAGLAPLVV